MTNLLTGLCHANSENSSGRTRPFSGICIIENFVSKDEEAALLHDLEKIPWDPSQSGRRKQNFGPRANFKKKKAKVGPFVGFPSCTKIIQDRFRTVPLLASYRTVEQCSIEYRKF